jgi:hypothetical protein
MGEVVDVTIADALANQRRCVQVGAAAFSEALKRWMSVSIADGAPNAPYRRWWLFDPGGNATEFVYVSEAALYRVGTHGERSAEYLDTLRDVAAMLKHFPVIWIDASSGNGLSVKHRPLDEAERSLKERYRAQLLEALAQIYDARYYGGYSFMNEWAMVISSDVDEPPDRVCVHIAPRPVPGQPFTTGNSEELDWKGEDANPILAASRLSTGRFRLYFPPFPAQPRR